MATDTPRFDGYHYARQLERAQEWSQPGRYAQSNKTLLSVVQGAALRWDWLVRQTKKRRQHHAH